MAGQAVEGRLASGAPAFFPCGNFEGVNWVTARLENADLTRPWLAEPAGLWPLL